MQSQCSFVEWMESRWTMDYFHKIWANWINGRTYHSQVCVCVGVFVCLKKHSGNCDVIECRVIHRISIEMISVR